MPGLHEVQAAFADAMLSGNGTAGLEILEDRDAARVNGPRLLAAARVDDRDLGDDQRRLGRIEHRHPERRPDAGPLDHLARRKRRETEHDGHARDQLIDDSLHKRIHCRSHTDCRTP